MPYDALQRAEDMQAQFDWALKNGPDAMNQWARAYARDLKVIMSIRLRAMTQQDLEHSAR